MIVFLAIVAGGIGYFVINYLIKKLDETTFVYFVKVLLNVFFIIVMPMLVINLSGFDLKTVYSTLMLASIIGVIYILIEINSQHILSYKLVTVPILLCVLFLGVVFTSKFHVVVAQTEDRSYSRYASVNISDSNKKSIQRNDKLKYEIKEGFDESILVRGNTKPNSKVVVKISQQEMIKEEVIGSDNIGNFEKKIYLDNPIEGEVEVGLFIDNIEIKSDGQAIAKNKVADFSSNITFDQTNVVKKGQYLVGTDIPSGDYLAITDTENAIQWNEYGKEVNFIDSLYIRLNEGDYVTLPNIKLIDEKSLTDSAKLDLEYSMLKVGRDIESGSYTVDVGTEGVVKKYTEPISLWYEGEYVFDSHVYLEEGEYVFLNQSTLTKEVY